ncbi:MAG: hypothetical protein CM1200mP16_05660 [Nitrospina sp.]|nr:MAG: hypothetical protein CM1200mP16_05660 [Nitrospina sp.]
MPGFCLTKIADLDIETDRGIHIDKGVLTTSVDDILENPDIDIVIELSVVMILPEPLSLRR